MSCKVRDVAAKVAFVQLRLAELGVGFERPVDVASCRSLVD